MQHLQDLIELAKTDGGKFFVIDEKGETKLVIMAMEDYQKLVLGKLKKQVEDVDKVNREIVQAQVQEKKPGFVPTVLQNFSTTPLQDWRGSVKRSQTSDLREEVIDPSFDFEGPKTDF